MDECRPYKADAHGFTAATRELSLTRR